MSDDKMVEAAARELANTDGNDFDSNRMSDHDRDLYRKRAVRILTAALSGHVVVQASQFKIASEMEIVAGQYDPEKQTLEQEAAALRALDGMEAQADLWAESIHLNQMVKNVGSPSRLNNSVPKDIRSKMADRQEAQIDALIRMAFVEGYYWGGESRKQYDEYRRAMIQAAPPVPVERG